jgi:hypothetical protein
MQQSAMHQSLHSFPPPAQYGAAPYGVPPAGAYPVPQHVCRTSHIDRRSRDHVKIRCFWHAAVDVRLSPTQGTPPMVNGGPPLGHPAAANQYAYAAPPMAPVHMSPQGNQYAQQPQPYPQPQVHIARQ